MARWRVGCDACGAGAWVGPAPGGADAWCEACQRASFVAPPGGGGPALCPECRGALSIETLRFEELYGEIQNLAAVAAAWGGDPGPLAGLLPDRPRFLTDLDPPELLPTDAGPAREALQRLREGRFAAARDRLEDLLEDDGGTARLWRALGIARERLGDLARAEEAFSRALERAEDRGLRLARGALRARRADFAGAREDLERAGDTHEARWNRAALAVFEAVARRPGLPERVILEAARAAAGEMSPYWSEPTVGRLLWTLLVERVRARAPTSAPGCPDERVLRAAEGELEFDTFWDRALVVHGYAACGMSQDLARTAAALAAILVETLSAEPCLENVAAREIRARVGAAAAAVRAGDPARARAELETLLARDDLRRYRVPCAACGRGSVGVDGVEEGPPCTA